VEIEVDLDSHRVVDVAGLVIPMVDLPPPDATIQAMVGDWVNRTGADRLDLRIATATQTFDGQELRDFLQSVLREAVGADLAYYNQGGIRSIFRKGPVTIRDVWTVEPFGNTIVRVRVRGDQVGGYLREDLEAQAVALDPTREYIVATSSYVADHLEKYFGSGPMHKEDSGTLVRDSIIAHLREHGLPTVGRDR